jgi:hypothetical protein
MALAAEHVEVLWEQRFDVADLPGADWKIEGGAALKDGALWSKSDPKAPVFIGVRGLRQTPIPAPEDGCLLRVEWTLTPVKLGGWGQDCNIENGPFVVEFTGARPTLNARYPSKDAVKEGQPNTLTCDFNRSVITSWTINGKQQLDAPVPAWRTGAEIAKVNLCDYNDTHSETRWLSVKVSRVTPDDTLPLRIGGWDDLNAPQKDQPVAFLTGQAGSMDKVFREASDFRGSLDPHVHIAAAGRERESFQLVVLPTGAALKGVNVSVTDLLQQDGKARLPASQVSWHPVGYVQTKPSGSAIRRAGWWWPDVLLPAKPFDVQPGFVQPVWFTVDVRAGTPAGKYRGLVTLRPEGAAPQTVGLELTVRPFDLPLRGKLKTAFCLCAGLWEMWYKPDEVKKRMGMTDKDSHGVLYTSYECEDVLPHAKWLEMYDFLLAHRLNPTTIYSSLKNGKSRVVPSRADMQYCYDRGMNATCLTCVDNLSADPKAADQRMQELEAWLADWNKFFADKNWPDFTPYIHGFDESDMRPDHEKNTDPSIQRVFGMIGQKFPRFKRESANPVNPAHIGLFDIWTPLTAQWQPGYRDRQKAGDEVWAYVCCGPGKPFANFFVDFPGVDPRILPWQLYQHNVTGFLYYLMDYYEVQENWNMAAPKWPDRPWNLLSFGTNSDGLLIYPGPDATPLASIRMENLRDGIQDYEALAMLADLTAQAEKAGKAPDLVTQARQVLAVRPEVSKSWTEYTQDGAKIVSAREEVDMLIEKIRAATAS